MQITGIVHGIQSKSAINVVFTTIANQSFVIRSPLQNISVVVANDSVVSIWAYDLTRVDLNQIGIAACRFIKFMRARRAEKPRTLGRINEKVQGARWTNRQVGYNITARRTYFGSPEVVTSTIESSNESIVAASGNAA